MKKLLLMAAVVAMVLVAAAPAMTQNEASVNADQILQQVGGDQYATATGSGAGDVAAANNQTFDATQTQQNQAVAGDNNDTAQNIGDVTVTGDARDLTGDGVFNGADLMVINVPLTAGIFG